MKSTLAVMALSTLFALSACDRNEGPVERAGKQVDNAAAQAGKQIEKAGDKIEDAAKDTKKKLSN